MQSLPFSVVLTGPLLPPAIWTSGENLKSDVINPAGAR